MRRARRAVCLFLLLAQTGYLTASSAPTPPGRRRFALVTGCNDGGKGRTRLRYAVEDAKAVARVLRELGGVSPEDCLVLERPDPDSLRQAFRELEGRLAASALPASALEVFFYYSGHSDEEGILLGGKRCDYQSLRDSIGALPADLRIAVLDSCSSGALTRGKGGVDRPPFLADLSSELKGHVFLTSSSETEAAQESDRIGGSFFTHHFITGLRGAADFSRDGRVTLNEAYQFAFDETLASTEKTRRGPQHPSYDINMTGRGDLVLTDIRNATASLVVPEGTEGRLFVRDARGILVAELRKTAGEPVQIALPPGAYNITLAREGGLLAMETTVAEGVSTSLPLDRARPIRREPTQARGLPSDPGTSRPYPGARRQVLYFGTGLAVGAATGFFLAYYFDREAREARTQAVEAYDAMGGGIPPPPSGDTNDQGAPTADYSESRDEFETLSESAEDYALRSDYCRNVAIGAAVAGAGFVGWWGIARWRSHRAGLAATERPRPPVTVVLTPVGIRLTARF